MTRNQSTLSISKKIEESKTDTYDEVAIIEEKEHVQKQKKNKYKKVMVNFEFDLNLIDEKYLRETQEIYYAQCPSLHATYHKQQALFKLAAIGRKHDYPLLLNLVDCYLRDKFDYFLRNPNVNRSITVQEWCNNFKTVQKLISKNRNKQCIHGVIQAAIKTYLHRYCSPIQLPTLYLIRDSIRGFIRLIQEVGELILDIQQNSTVLYPYQIDLVIIPQDVIDIANYEETVTMKIVMSLMNLLQMMIVIVIVIRMSHIHCGLIWKLLILN
eukprot:47727_1